MQSHHITFFQTSFLLSYNHFVCPHSQFLLASSPSSSLLAKAILLKHKSDPIQKSLKGKFCGMCHISIQQTKSSFPCLQDKVQTICLVPKAPTPSSWLNLSQCPSAYIASGLLSCHVLPYFHASCSCWAFCLECFVPQANYLLSLPQLRAKFTCLKIYHFVLHCMSILAHIKQCLGL